MLTLDSLLQGSEGFTYHEKRALGFGTVKERLGKVSYMSSQAILLTLMCSLENSADIRTPSWRRTRWASTTTAA